MPPNGQVSHMKSPEPKYYNSDTRPKKYKKCQNPNVYLPPPLDTEDLRR